MIKSICYLAGISILSFFVGRALPYKWFPYDKFPFRPAEFEKQGKIYLKLKINKWQNKVPDMSKIFPGLIPAKNLKHYTPEVLPGMIEETCIAEFIHCGNSILSLFSLCFCRNWAGILVVAVYILLGNLPFILIQRYNRPRFVKLLEHMNSRQEREHIHENADPKL